MHPQRRTALVSVVAAATLVALKLATGLVTGSLGLVSEALHSGTDLVAALLTLFAVGVAIRPADVSHQYGHGKAEHLAALGEASILALASFGIVIFAALRLSGVSEGRVEATWYAFVVVVVVIAIDAGRTIVSARTARRFHSEALRSNAIHFASDMAGSTAVLFGLVAAAAGYPNGDSLAGLFVAALVLLAAGRLMRRNVDVLMDRAPADALAAAGHAIRGLRPDIDLRRLRLRQAAGRHFVDVVIGVPPGAAVGQGHAAADEVEAAVQRALPESDIVVHVEPAEEEELRDRAHAAALGVPRVREVHNVTVLSGDGRTEISLHLKLPGDLPLEDAHAVATSVERAIAAAVPEVDSVQTHVEPLSEEAGMRPAAGTAVDEATVMRIVAEETGRQARELRFLQTDEGLFAFLTLSLEPGETLAGAHELASRVEERVHAACPRIAELIVHTEP
jgi:cation diffusion facilitator family transporter